MKVVQSELVRINDIIEQTLSLHNFEDLHQLAEQQESAVTQLFSVLSAENLTPDISALLYNTIQLNTKVVDALAQQKNVLVQQQFDLKRHLNARNQYAQTEQL